MSGDYMIHHKNRHIGRVMSFAGNKANERWVAYAVRDKVSDPERRESFPTRKAAIVWLEQQAA